MDKKTILAFILMGVVFMVWMYMTTPPNKPKPLAKKTDTTKVQIDTTKKLEVNQDTLKQNPIVNTPVRVDTSKYFTNSSAPERLIWVYTDKSVFTLSTKGGNLKQVWLKDFSNFYAKEGKSFFYNHVSLLDTTTFDITLVSQDGKPISTKSISFNSDSQDSILVKGDQKVTVTFTADFGSGRQIIKSFTFTGNKYDLNAAVELNGLKDLVAQNTYNLDWDASTRFVEENSVDEANYAKASIYQGGEHTIFDASNLGKNEHPTFNGKVDWFAIRDKYFTTIVTPEKPEDVSALDVKGVRTQLPDKGVHEGYSASYQVPFNNSNSEKKNFNIYLGPVDYDVLKGYGKNYPVIIDFGSFFGLKFIVRPIAEYVFLPLFKFLHMFISNFGLVIIIFSIIIKILLHPFTKKSMYSMKKMSLLQPKITEIKEKYKDDPQKMNKETMALYSKYGINPAGGCLPLLLQMPVFVALWGLFQAAIELRLQPFVFWIHDLSRPDIIATLPFSLFGIHQISGLALLMGITTFVQQKMTIKDPSQKSMVYIMPVFLTLMFMSFPSGLNLYYFMFNLLSIAQQEYVNRKHSDMQLVEVQNPKKKGGFMQKLMNAAEESQKRNQQSRKKK